MGDYCKIFTLNKMHHIHFTLDAITSRLPSDKFYRCHRSFTINVDRIEKIEDNIIYIDKNYILTGEQYRRELLKLINYIGTTYENKKN